MTLSDPEWLAMQRRAFLEKAEEMEKRAAGCPDRHDMRYRLIRAASYMRFAALEIDLERAPGWRAQS